MSLTQFVPISRARKRRNIIMRGVLMAGTTVALIPLGLVLYFLISKGAGSLNGNFFTTDPTGNFFGNQGGVRSAILGSLEIVGLASLIAIPTGVGVALYLTEYGKQSRFANVIRYFVDVMTGVPSIVFGLFVYIVLVKSHIGGDFTGWKGSVALSLLMLPVVVRAAEVVLLLVPSGLREAALALGAPRWRVVSRVVLPTAIPGLVTGTLLAIARGMGETAPLLFTVSVAFGATADLGAQMNTLPVQIFNDISSPNTALTNRAWGAALTLVALVLILNLIARAVARRSRMA
ncbi:MAG TPA: phosphate ABC transporter permease PstA [Solirubrobacteraceae bacterium]